MIKKTNENKKRLVRNVVIFFFAFVLFSAMILLTNLQSLTLLNSFVMAGCVLIFVGSLAFYIYYTDKEVAKSSRKVATLCLTMIISYLLIFVCDKAIGLREIAPFALCSLILTTLVSRKCSFFVNFVVVILYYLQYINFQQGEVAFSELNFFMLFAGVMNTVAVSYIFRHYRYRLSYIIVGLILGLVTGLCRLLIFLMVNVDLDWRAFYPSFLWSLGSGIVTVMIMFLLLPVLERLFNVVSPFRFSEIATTNNELMRKLYEVAPGTFNHSLTVANYVEACASAIGENTFLARAASYYHDIGKMKNPAYFTENQTDGVNPHDQITPESSVAIIKSHVSHGLALAKQHKLPVEIQQAIAEHHGTMPITYFYRKAQKYTDGELPVEQYSYNGPKPTSKISAILMICDACEAALRAESDKAKAEDIVDAIVAERMDRDQFTECDLTMREIEIIKNTILTTYMGIKHNRIKYPKIKSTGDK